MDPEEILAQARAALMSGAARGAVDRRVAQITKGQFKSVRELEAAAKAPQGSALSDFGRSLAQGATFGTADELVGLVQGEKAGQASRDRVAAIRKERPVSSFVGEMLGGSWVPGLGAAKVGAGVLKATGSRVFAGLAGGSAGGAVGGGVTGAAEANPGERIMGAIGGTALGAAAGAAGGALVGSAGRIATRMTGAAHDARDWAGGQIREVLDEAGVDPKDLVNRLRELGPGSVPADLGQNVARKTRAAINSAPSLSVEGGPVDMIQRRNAGTGTRVAEELRGASGLPGTYRSSKRAAVAGVKDVRKNFYRPLEAKYPAVEGPNVNAVLADPHVASVAARVAPDAGGRPLSFQELQDVLSELRDDASEAYRKGRPGAVERSKGYQTRLEEALEKDIPEFGPAQAAYRVAVQTREAHALGRKLATKPLSDITDEMEKLPPEAQDAFRQGLLDRWETALRSRGTGGAKASEVIDMINAPEIAGKLRAIVGSDEGMQKLLAGRDREYRWRRTWAAMSGNSTTAQQGMDILVPEKIPTGKLDAFYKAVSYVVGMSPTERQAAWEMIGRVLLSDGEEAARMLAEDLSSRKSWSAITGAAGGTATVREAHADRGRGAGGIWE